jgi:hypothetical protein
VTWDFRNTEEGLAGSSISCPPVDDQLLSTYFDYFIRTGFLQGPEQLERPTDRPAERAGRTRAPLWLRRGARLVRRIMRTGTPEERAA